MLHEVVYTIQYEYIVPFRKYNGCINNLTKKKRKKLENIGTWTRVWA